MNIWVRRSLEATLLAAGFVVVGGGIANAAEPASEPLQQPAQLGQALPGIPDPTAVLDETVGNPLGSPAAKQSASKASATEEQSTDRGRNTTPRPRSEPAHPVDAGVAVPIKAADNAVGTPLGQKDFPVLDSEVNTRDVTDPAQEAAAPVAVAAAPALEAAAPATSAVNEVASAAIAATRYNSTEQDTPFSRPERAPAAPPHGDPFLGNRVNANLVVPIQLVGNAVALGGPVSVEGSSQTQSYDGSQDVTTGGAGAPLAGNVVDADWAVPLQVAGNAVAAAGAAETIAGHAAQNVTTGGDDTTDGRGGALSGNVLTGQGATPVQLDGNAVSGAGVANVDGSHATTTANSGGAVDTAGTESFGSGNVGAVPLGLPAEVNGNAPTIAGVADSVSSTEADVTSGGTKPGNLGRPTYVQTDGDWALLSGNVAQPQGSSVANVSSVAAALGGDSTTGNAVSPIDPIADPFSLPMVLGGSELRGTAMKTVWPLPSRGKHARTAGTNSSKNDVTSGGYTTTSSRNGTGSGNVADAPVAAPADVYAIGGNLVEQSHAAHDNVTDTTAGGKTFTNGNGSALSGNTASSPLAGTAETFAVGAGAIGDASGTATETKNVKSGGYNGTLGDNSLGAGNVATTPLAVPGEVFGAGAGGIGTGAGTATETKTVSAGDDGSTVDDYGTVSSNIAAVPGALPVQVFGIGAGGVGQGIGTATADTKTKAGDDYKSSAMLGTIAGNIAQAPVALPTQVHGLGGGAVGSGYGLSDNLTEATAGGKNVTDGKGGSLTGNVVHAPAAGNASAFALAADAIGESYGDAINDVTSASGGDSTTAGDEGFLAGNAVGLETLPVAGAFNTAASGLGQSDAYGTNVNSATSGGDVTSSGATGSLAGNIVDVPTASPAQVFDDSVAALGGVATSGDYNELTGSSGGSTVTDAADLQIPLTPRAHVADQEIELLGDAFSQATHLTDVQVGEGQFIDLPLVN